jgi:hypothetical protein
VGVVVEDDHHQQGVGRLQVGDLGGVGVLAGVADGVKDGGAGGGHGLRMGYAPDRTAQPPGRTRRRR